MHEPSKQPKEKACKTRELDKASQKGRCVEMATKNEKIVVELGFYKETPGTYRFDDPTGNEVIRSLYVEKRAYKTQPKKIRVTVEVIA
jgi:hypothetical protein